MGFLFNTKPSIKVGEFLSQTPEEQITYIRENMRSKSIMILVKSVLKETKKSSLIEVCLEYITLHKLKDSVPLLMNIVLHNHKDIDKSLVDSIFSFIEKYAKQENIDYMMRVTEDEFLKVKVLGVLYQRNLVQYDEFIKEQVEQGNHEFVEMLIKKNQAEQHYDKIIKKYEEYPMEVFDFVDSFNKNQLVSIYKLHSGLLQEFLAYMKQNIFTHEHLFVRQFFNLLVRFEVVDLDILYYIYTKAEIKEKQDVLSLVYNQISQYKVRFPKEHLVYELFMEDKENPDLSLYVDKIDRRVNFSSLFEKQKLKKQFAEEHTEKVVNTQPVSKVLDKMEEQEVRNELEVNAEVDMKVLDNNIVVENPEPVVSLQETVVEKEMDTEDILLEEQTYLEPIVYFDFENEEIYNQLSNLQSESKVQQDEIVTVSEMNEVEPVFKSNEKEFAHKQVDTSQKEVKNNHSDKSHSNLSESIFSNIRSGLSQTKNSKDTKSLQQSTNKESDNTLMQLLGN